MKHLVIIGGGASGMACALTAARRGLKVTVLEGCAKPLRKLAASGNGRGNLANRRGLRYMGDSPFARAVFDKVSPKDVEHFWEQAGVPLTEEVEGRLYPSDFNAPSAAAALTMAVTEAGAEILCNVKVLSIQKQESGFNLQCRESLYEAPVQRKNGKTKAGALVGEREFRLKADGVALCAGGCAAPEFGTDGNAYALAQAFGHKLVPLKPALCALTTEESFPASLLGQRAKAALKLLSKEGAVLAESEGEILFADHSISGIAAMQLARFWQPGCIAEINLSRSLFGYSCEEREGLSFLQKRQEQFPNRTGEALLCGCCTATMGRYLCHLGETLPLLAHRICALRLPISGPRGFEAAQFTAGGLCCEEWNPSTMESRLQPKMYAAGEILDVDGDCGGYNLMFAVASGILLGQNALKM